MGRNHRSGRHRFSAFTSASRTAFLGRARSRPSASPARRSIDSPCRSTGDNERGPNLSGLRQPTPPCSGWRGRMTLLPREALLPRTFKRPDGPSFPGPVRSNAGMVDTDVGAGSSLIPCRHRDCRETPAAQGSPRKRGFVVGKVRRHPCIRDRHSQGLREPPYAASRARPEGRRPECLFVTDKTPLAAMVDYDGLRTAFFCWAVSATSRRTS